MRVERRELLAGRWAFLAGAAATKFIFKHLALLAGAINAFTNKTLLLAMGIALANEASLVPTGPARRWMAAVLAMLRGIWSESTPVML